LRPFCPEGDMNRRIEEVRPLDGERLLTPREAADFLRVSMSWLAKARMRGDGPAFLKVGRCVRYRESALLQWLRSQQRLSTSER
jgi:predicted DNA-binding transcriptional regulator AlpA